MYTTGRGPFVIHFGGPFVIQSVSIISVLSVVYHQCIIMYYQNIIRVSTYVSSYHVSTYVSSYVSTMYHRPPTVNTMYHPQWYVTRGWYNIILHSTCITMDRLSSQSIIDDTIWYITWYIMIHVSSKSTLIHWWYVVIHMYQPWTELIQYMDDTLYQLRPGCLRVGGDYVDTLLIHR